METTGPSLYESSRLLDEYLLFHYGNAAEVLPWDFGPKEALDFPVRTVTHFLDGSPRGRALDLGCAVGRSSFELSRFCREVTGIDYSQSFIAAGEALRSTGRVEYSSLVEGSRKQRLCATVPAGCQPDRIAFEQGDAMNLRSDLGQFDIVHAANLLCRVSQPAKLLAAFPALLRSGGTLIITTPCTWLEDFTPRDCWPDQDTLEWLRAMLEPWFSLQSRADLPFIIREHARKFQWSVALGTVWTRNP